MYFQQCQNSPAVSIHFYNTHCKYRKVQINLPSPLPRLWLCCKQIQHMILSATHSVQKRTNRFLRVSGGTLSLHIRSRISRQKCNNAFPMRFSRSSALEQQPISLVAHCCWHITCTAQRLAWLCKATRGSSLHIAKRSLTRIHKRDSIEWPWGDGALGRVHLRNDSIMCANPAQICAHENCDEAK